MFEKIKNYFKDRYILKTFQNASYDINFTDLDFASIINKYDVKPKFEDKLLVYSILSVAFEKSGTKEEILYEVLLLDFYNFNESTKTSNKKQYLEICKLKLEKKYIENKNKDLLDLPYLDEVSEFSPLCFSKDNFDNAMKHIQNLIENNEKDTGLFFSSYKMLSYSKNSIELAFLYLRDSITFDEKSPVFNDKTFKEKINFLHMTMLLSYFDVDVDELPKNLHERMKFSANKKESDIGKNELEITNLITWRNKEQWLYFANAHGIDSDLGKLCLQKSESI